MSDFMGEFTGFSLGDFHSSILNLCRVTQGDRYEEYLTSQFADQTVQIPGSNGTYYWNSYLTSKQFTINFAFDDLREEDLKSLKQIFGTQKIVPLIFDEQPHKKYMVKAMQPPTIKYIPFDTDYQTGLTVYKGEGSAALVAYYPYGIGTQTITISAAKQYTGFNQGELPCPLRAYYPASGTIQIYLDATTQLKLENVSAYTGDTYLCIDSRTNLIEGYNSTFTKTGTLYNRFITSGDFFKLPLDGYTINSNVNWTKLEFNYLYY